jgi:serine/threonine protein kinase
VFGATENGVRGKAGTPGFWAPEMLYYERDGKGRRYGPAADWWSFGCLLYALLASR